MTSVSIAALGNLGTLAMGSLCQGAAGLVLEHCHLLTSTRRTLSSQQSAFIDIVNNKDSYIGLEALSHSLVPLLQAAWAPLYFA